MVNACQGSGGVSQFALDIIPLDGVLPTVRPPAGQAIPLGAEVGAVDGVHPIPWPLGLVEIIEI